ncbi:ATP-binding protein [Oscillatoria sp. FACHB-1407]|uniref:ATP-binding protein n=1 Tax=Oscillatoria sp. FACHB-1407 TaxID=2692847 RepID=UPI0018EF9A10|nr:ATP-binding protein [Oscillatoria sp. FACHB-1407]
MPDDSFLVLEVKDTGKGIALEKQHLLFQAFQQIDSTNHPQLAGSGLGLVLSKQ